MNYFLITILTQNTKLVKRIQNLSAKAAYIYFHIILSHLSHFLVLLFCFIIFVKKKKKNGFLLCQYANVASACYEMSVKNIPLLKMFNSLGATLILFRKM